MNIEYSENETCEASDTLQASFTRINIYQEKKSFGITFSGLRLCWCKGLPNLIEQEIIQSYSISEPINSVHNLS